MKKVLVTGSTQGIGKAIAARLVRDGFYVYVHCRADEQKAERVRAEIGAHAAVVCDLSEPNRIAALRDKTGDVDVLVLNASVQYKQRWEEISDEEIDKQVRVNLVSSLKLMQTYYPAMRQNGWGRIIAIGSVNQHRQHRELALYAATKCAVMSLVKNIAKEAAPFGVTVNNVSPGVVRTPRNAAVLNDPTESAAVKASIPAGRFAAPEECSGIVAFLAGEESGYLTGADIKLDGGMSL